MNVNNEISRHEPYTIDDISSIKLDFDFEESISHLPECIICKLTEIEQIYEPLIENDFCECVFHYHDCCYEEWIQYKQTNKCLICNIDISSNYYIRFTTDHNPPTIRRRRELFVLTRQERIRLRILDIQERPYDCCDELLNLICFRCPIHRRNPHITWCMIYEDNICKTGAASICVIGLIVLIILIISIQIPWIFTTR